MKKNIFSLFLIIAASVVVLTGCNNVSVNIETKETSVISDNSATVSAYISEYEEMPSSVGVYFGEAEDGMTKLIKDTTPGGKMNSEDINVSYDIAVDGGKTLKPDTTYYYQFYARFDTKEARGELKTFTTLKNVLPAPVSVELKEITDLTATKARINAHISNYEVKPEETGLYIGASPDELKKAIQDKEPYKNYNLKEFDVWYDVELSPETTYYYCCYARLGKGETRTEVKSFTTPAAPDTTEAPQDK